MTKTILITGATDGIGLETAKALAAQGHKLWLHGRNPEKLARIMADMPETAQSVLADLSSLSAVATLAKQIKSGVTHLDVLINNAGVLAASDTLAGNGMDVRFMVNTLAPYRLTKDLLPIMDKTSRVVNLSSAAQAPVNLKSLTDGSKLEDFPAYAMSKLAITMWTAHMARTETPQFYPVNPGSYLGTKMVTEWTGMKGNDVNIGVDILCRAALSEEFDGRSGEYFDNDSGQFAPMHSAGQDLAAQAALAAALDEMLEDQF